MKGQIEGSLTSNFKVIRQGHVNYSSIFGFYDLSLVENDTNQPYYFITSTSKVVSINKQW